MLFFKTLGPLFEKALGCYITLVGRQGEGEGEGQGAGSPPHGVPGTASRRVHHVHGLLFVHDPFQRQVSEV